MGSADLTWRKSSRTNPNNCVEIAWPSALVAVRDSKNPGPTLTFGRPQLARLLSALTDPDQPDQT
jgi:hypothetical protein